MGYRLCISWLKNYLLLKSLKIYGEHWRRPCFLMKSILLTLFVAFLVLPATAGDVFVTNNLDDGSPESLRERIVNAAADTRICFDGSLSGKTIQLQLGELLIDENLMIDASDLPGGIVLSGDKSGDGSSADDSRVFLIDGSLTVTLKSLTITGGRVPGGVRSGGGVSVTNGTNLTMEQCTVSYSQAADDGFGHGGGISSTSGSTVSLEQCTVSHTRAGDDPGVGGDGGGMHLEGSFPVVTITDSIIAGNLPGLHTTESSHGEGADINRDDFITAHGINLIGDNTLAIGNASTVFQEGATVGTGANPLDALLGVLGTNGGPTETFLPLRGSPALNPTGGNAASAFVNDQRGVGFPRIVLDIVDTGAVEAPDYAAIDAANAAQAAAKAAQQAALFKKLKKLKKKGKTPSARSRPARRRSSRSRSKS